MSESAPQPISGLEVGPIQPPWWTHGNISFYADTGAWADFRVDGLPFGPISKEENDEAAEKHRDLAVESKPWFLLKSMAVPTSADDVAGRMTTTEEIQEHPLWRIEADQQLRRMRSWRMRGRELWVSVPLDDASKWGNLPELENNPKRPSGRALAEYERRAGHARRSLPRELDPKPVTEEMLRWQWRRALTLGVAAEQIPGWQQESSFRALGKGAFPTGVFDDGARLDQPRRWWHNLFPPKQATEAVLRVSQLDKPDAPPSYQVWHLIETWPPYRLAFPGSEVFTLLDKLPFDVDMAQRLLPVDRSETEEWVKKNHGNLKSVRKDVAAEEDEEGLDEADFTDRLATLNWFRREFNDHDTEKELRFATVLTVSGPTAQIAAERSKNLVKRFAAKSISLIAPKGDQIQLACAAFAGADLRGSVVIEDHLTTTLTHEWAKHVPLIANRVGDPRGPVIGYRIDSAAGQAVHHDPGQRAAQNMPTGVIFVGPPGGGKSYLLKTEVTYAVMRGGVAGLIDVSEHGEYEDWLAVLGPALGGPHKTALFNFAEKDWEKKKSLDPSRIFKNPITRSRWLETVLLGLFGLPGKSGPGRALRHMLRPTYWADHGIDSIASLGRHVAALAETVDAPEHSRQLADLFEDWRDEKYAECFFDDRLEPLDIYTPQVVVFRTNILTPPSDTTLVNGHLYAEIPDFERFGRYASSLVCAILEDICFRDKKQIAIAGFDELHRYFTIETQPVFKRFSQQGRKTNASAFYADQLGDNIPAYIWENAAAVMAFRHKSVKAARRLLERMDYPMEGLDQMARTLCKLSPKDDPDRKGEFLFHDDAGNHGLVRSVGPAIREIAQACSTTPGDEPDDQDEEDPDDEPQAA